LKAENVKRSKNNRFLPVYKTWSLENFNEGYTVKHGGRFWVRLPKHHRANPSGNVLRSIAAYEAYHPGIKVTKEYNIHHKDENRLNDSEENLVMLKHGEHTRLHWKGKSRKGQNDHLKNGRDLNCEYCGKAFYRAPWETNKTNFCSRKCFHESKREVRTCPVCKTSFKIIKSSSKECCSRKCGFELKHERRMLNV